MHSASLGSMQLEVVHTVVDMRPVSSHADGGGCTVVEKHQVQIAGAAIDAQRCAFLTVQSPIAGGG